jgi:hypothetical protein
MGGGVNTNTTEPAKKIIQARYKDLATEGSNRIGFKVNLAFRTTWKTGFLKANLN